MFIIIGLFILGTMFGSFGSVILQRMQRKITWKAIQGFLFGRSECPKCHHQLHRYNLIPLFSRFRQGGKCAYCKAPISSLYPTIEIVSGLIFALWGWIYLMPYLYGIGDLSVMMLIFWWLLGLLLVWDIYTYELHIPVWFVLVVSIVIYSIVLSIQGLAQWSWLIGSVVFLFVFLVIYWFGYRYAKFRFGQAQEVFGQGDVMLVPVLGYLFALQQISQDHIFSLLLFFVVGSSLVGLIYYSITMMIYKLKKYKDSSHIHSTGSPMIPFLPSMIIAYWIIVIWMTVLYI